MLFSLTLFLWRLYRHFATMFSSERLTVPDYVSRLQRGRSGSGSGSGSSPGSGCDPRAVSPGIAADIQAVLDTSLPALRGAIRKLRMGKEHGLPEETRTAIAKIFQLVEEAWVLPTVGRQVAEEICNRIRLEGGLELLLQLQQTPDVEITYESAKLLEQILVSENRWGATDHSVTEPIWESCNEVNTHKNELEIHDELNSHSCVDFCLHN